MTARVDVAYAAGVIDSDGWIGVKRKMEACYRKAKALNRTGVPA